MGERRFKLNHPHSAVLKMLMKKILTDKEKTKFEIQRKNVTSLYNEVASVYDESFDGKAKYKIPQKLLEIYQKHGITEGKVLDIGCGTGKLRQYLGNNFTYEGVDISSAMIEEVKKRGLKGHVGAIEDIIETFTDKSVDHITALSSLFFIKDWKKLAKEFDRVARKSIFVSLEQFEPEIIEMMKERGISVYNHSASIIKNPTEIIKNVFLWIRPTVKEMVPIFGDLVFKKLS